MLHAGKELSEAAWNGRTAEVFQLVERHGAALDVGWRDDSGRTAVYRACFNGHTEVVQLLVDTYSAAALGVGVGSKAGSTPLIWACGGGRRGCVEALMNAFTPEECAATTATYNGKAAVEGAREKKHDAIATLVEGT